MRTLSRKMTGLFCLMLLTLTAGCVTRSVLRFEDHPSQHQTFVETLRHSNYLLTSDLKHEFWLCRDDESALVCKATCDADTDLACPTVGGSINITSNYR